VVGGTTLVHGIEKLVLRPIDTLAKSLRSRGTGPSMLSAYIVHINDGAT
jgi:hypothetical protein